MLRLAACWRSTSPHSMANAVVEEPDARDFAMRSATPRWSIW